MAKYGCAYAKWAPFKTTGADAVTTAFPKYGTPIVPGSLVSVKDNPSFSEAKLYADDALKEYVNAFKECAVTVEVDEITNDTASSMFGATIDSDSDNLEFNSADTAPFGGLAFFTTLSQNGVTYYQGVYYPKVKAVMSGSDYVTKGDSISFATGTMTLTASAPACGKWKVLSDKLDTITEAKAWVDDLIKAST